jgi:hypothetical protein
MMVDLDLLAQDSEPRLFQLEEIVLTFQTICPTVQLEVRTRTMVHGIHVIAF